MKKTIYFVLAFCIGFASCKKNDTTTNTSNTIPEGSVFALNQGDFGHGNASVTMYNPATKAVTADIFKTVNNRALGDVAQSMLVYNGKGYIVVNNSAKIEVVDMTTFKSLATISITGSSPRYILPIGGNKGYVTDYYSGVVSIIDLNAYTVTGSITIGGETEQMAMANGNVYILNIINSDTTYVKVVNPTSNTVTSSIMLGLRGGVGLTKDSSQNVWVLCGPYDTTYTLQSGMIKINTTSNTISQTLSYPASQQGFSNLTIGPDGNTICFLGPLGVYKMTASGGQLPTTAFISQGSHYFYGVEIDSAGQKIYVGDGSSFTANDKAYSFNLSTGAAIDTIQAGIAPCFFTFE